MQESPSWGLLYKINANQVIPFCPSRYKITPQEPQLPWVTASSLELPVLSPSLPALVLPAVDSKDMALQRFDGLFPKEVLLSMQTVSPGSSASPATACPWDPGHPKHTHLAPVMATVCPQDGPVSHVPSLEVCSHSAQAIHPDSPIDPIP